MLERSATPTAAASADLGDAGFGAPRSKRGLSRAPSGLGQPRLLRLSDMLACDAAARREAATGHLKLTQASGFFERPAPELGARVYVLGVLGKRVRSQGSLHMVAPRSIRGRS